MALFAESHSVSFCYTLVEQGEWLPSMTCASRAVSSSVRKSFLVAAALAFDLIFFKLVEAPVLRVRSDADVSLLDAGSLEEACDLLIGDVDDPPLVASIVVMLVEDAILLLTKVLVSELKVSTRWNLRFGLPIPCVKMWQYWLFVLGGVEAKEVGRLQKRGLWEEEGQEVKKQEGLYILRIVNFRRSNFAFACACKYLPAIYPNRMFK